MRINEDGIGYTGFWDWTTYGISSWDLGLDLNLEERLVHEEREFYMKKNVVRCEARGA